MIFKKAEELVEKTEENVENKPVEEEKDNDTCRISQDLKKLLVEQISHELYNHNLYRTFANFYGTRGFTLLEKYYIKRAEEEKLHHDWIIDYLGEVDAEVSYPGVEEISEKPKTLMCPFGMTIEKEKETTELINAIADQSVKERDWQTFSWLNNKLVPEQTEEMSTSQTAFDLANSDASWATKEEAILKAYENRI